MSKKTRLSKNLRQKNAALGLVLLGVVVIFYILAMVRLKF